MRERSVVIVVFDDVQGLDVFGPADVFYFANYLAERTGATSRPYRTELAAQQAGQASCIDISDHDDAQPPEISVERLR